MRYFTKYNAAENCNFVSTYCVYLYLPVIKLLLSHEWYAETIIICYDPDISLSPTIIYNILVFRPGFAGGNVGM